MAIPFGFTADYHPPAALDAAYREFCAAHGHTGSIMRSHMWHRFSRADTVDCDGHRCEIFTADLRPPMFPGVRRTIGPGPRLSLAVCEPCQWHTIGDEPYVVVAWHDHAIPDWRVLPVMPGDVRDRELSGWGKKAMAWLEEHVPADLQRDGAPIVTERQPPGNRHVPGYSPWGGYDLSHWALDIAPTTEVTDRGLAISHPTLF